MNRESIERERKNGQERVRVGEKKIALSKLKEKIVMSGSIEDAEKKKRFTEVLHVILHMVKVCYNNNTSTQAHVASRRERYKYEMLLAAVTTQYHKLVSKPNAADASHTYQALWTIDPA